MYYPAAECRICILLGIMCGHASGILGLKKNSLKMYKIN